MQTKESYQIRPERFEWRRDERDRQNERRGYDVSDTNGGCHPLWVLGHLTMVEGMIPAALFGDKNP